MPLTETDWASMVMSPNILEVMSFSLGLFYPVTATAVVCCNLMQIGCVVSHKKPQLLGVPQNPSLLLCPPIILWDRRPWYLSIRWLPIPMARNLLPRTNTHSTALCPGLPGWAGTRKIKPIWFYWSKRQWVAVTSAGPYTSLCLLSPDR